MYMYSTYSNDIYTTYMYMYNTYTHIPVHIHIVMIYIQHFKNLLFLNSNTTVKSHFSNRLEENIFKYKNHVHWPSTWRDTTFSWFPAKLAK